MNICGVLVHADPRRMQGVLDALTKIEGLEVHRIADAGRIVVTVEDTENVRALDALTAIHKTDGVVAAALTYHQFESSADGTAL